MPQDAQDRVRLKGPGGKFYTLPSKQIGAFLQKNPDYDIASAAPAAESPLKHFWQDRASSFHNIEGETFKRAAGALGSSLTSIPGALYHAAADPESDEESRKFGKGFEGKIGPAGRLI